MSRLDRWQGRDVGALRDAWQVPRLDVFRTTASTNDEARRLADAGAPSLTCVLADEQTAGRGRQGRSWTAPAGTALLASFVLRPEGGDRAAPSTVPLRVGMAAASAILRATDIAVQLKWPNDLLAADRKVGGILCEASTGGHGTTVIAGIGINVDQSEDDWPDTLRGHAVSLRMLVGHAVDRATLAGALVDELRAVLPRIDRPLTAAERASWDGRDALHGRAVTIDGDEVGTVDGVTEDGALRLRTSRGVRLIRSGTVRLRSTAAREDR